MRKSFLTTVTAGIVSGLVVALVLRRLTAPQSSTAQTGGNQSQGVWV